MSVSIGARPARAKAMVVSSEARPTRAKATPVSRERFPMPAGHCGAWPGTESTHRATHQRPGATVWRAPEGPEGTGGLRDRPLRAAGSRVAISRAAGPDGARNTSGATSIKLNREFRLHRRCEGRKRAWLWRPWAAAEPGRAPSQRTEPHISDQAPLCGGRRRVRRARAGFEIDHSEPQARVWRSRGRPGTESTHRVNAPSHTSATRRHCVEGAGGTGGHGRASRRGAERSEVA